MAYTTIDDSQAHFQVATWTGDGNDDRNITLPGTTDMQPNVVWVKGRSDDDSHRFYDSTRGATKYLNTATNGAEGTSADGMQAFQSDGFQIGTDGSHNGNTKTYAGFCWKESADSGLDVVSYTGNGTARTISHNLSAVPKMMIFKNLARSDNWDTYHHYIGNGSALFFNSTAAADDQTLYFNDTTPTSSVFTIGSNTSLNADGEACIAYVFAPKQGFSKFGSYIGNGLASGTTVYTGFAPKLVITKMNGTANWVIKTKGVGDVGNIQTDFLYASNTAAEGDGSDIAFLGNGFKWMDTETNNNQAGSTYIYMAFAESPYVNSEGVPNNAL